MVNKFLKGSLWGKLSGEMAGGYRLEHCQVRGFSPLLLFLPFQLSFLIMSSALNPAPEGGASTQNAKVKKTLSLLPKAKQA